MTHKLSAFRSATAADVDAVVALVESAYRGESSRRGWTTEADLIGGQRTDRAEVSDLIDRPDSWILLSEENGSLAACCHLERRGDDLRFGLFAVDPGLQGRGIGRAMITEAYRRAQRAGSTAIRLTVIRQRTDLIAWYERLGFRASGATEPFPYGNPRFGVPKRDDLEFVVLVAPVTPGALDDV